MAVLDLNELINRPGYGKIQKDLISAKVWDESKAATDETKLKRFKIEVSGTYEPEIEHQTVTVEAYTADEAIDLAYEKTDFDEIEDHEILKVEDIQ